MGRADGGDPLLDHFRHSGLDRPFHLEVALIMAGLSFLNGRTVAVMGLGKSGMAAVRAFQAENITVLAWDDKPETRVRAAGDGITLVDPTRLDWSRIALLVWSPGIAHRHPAPHPVAEAARRQDVPIVCDIELLWRANSAARYIGITGTNGKSTTTTLIGHLLQDGKVAVGGNLGTAGLDLPALGADGTYVLELSSYQLELLDQAAFDIALLLNITPDHLGRHGGMAGYVAAKRSLFDRLRPGATAIIGVDDAECFAIHDRLRGRRDITLRPISAEKFVAGGISAPDGVLIDDSAGQAVRVCDLSQFARLPGRHNWQNACAAYAAGRASGLTAERIVAGFATYPGLSHRQELVAVIDGVRYVNDSKATNADAASKAMQCYDPIYWIAGGQAKEGGIGSLRPLFPRVRRAFLIGEAAAEFAVTLAGPVAFDECGTLDCAVAKAHAAAAGETASGAVVLLSPACASWDQFTSFEHRGEVFRTLVEKLPGERSAA
jgi:UDP-N-acetylmuramoylalanine--D-glutamate ligase